jgi:hypothetical protein
MQASRANSLARDAGERSHRVKSGAEFDAPWALPLKLTTTFSVCILVLIPIVGMISGPGGNVIWIASMIALPCAILGAAPFFMIRGYVVTDNSLLVRRLGWSSEISLRNLRSVEVDPEAMRKSIRVFANGGLFCFAGRFRNRKLGTYRAYATAPHLAVVLRFTDRVVVVTPGDPSEFASKVQELVAGGRALTVPD